MAKDCEFLEEDNMVRDIIVYGAQDKKVQERMLRKSDLTLKDAVDSCRAAESSQNQLAEIRKGEAFSVNEVSNQGVKCFKCNTLGHYANNCPNGQEQQGEKKLQCYNCKGYGHPSRICPSGDPNGYSRGRKKKSRGGRGRGRDRGRGGRSNAAREVHEFEDHAEEEYVQEFSTLSLSSLVFSDVSNQSPEPSPDDQVDKEAPTEETCAEVQAEQKDLPNSRPTSLNPLCVSSLAESTRKRFVKFRFHDVLKNTSKAAEAKIDSGAEANVMTLSAYKQLYPERFDANGAPLPQYMRTSTRKLEAYGGVEVPHLGTVNLPCEYDRKKFMCRFFLCDIQGSMLVGLPTCEALGIVKIRVVNELLDVGEEMESRESVKRKVISKPMSPSMTDHA